MHDCKGCIIFPVQMSPDIMLTLTLPSPSAGVSRSLDSYCSLKPLCSGMGEVVTARTSPTLLPHSLALCCHYPASKCPSASVVVTGTVRVNTDGLHSAIAVSECSPKIIYKEFRIFKEGGQKRKRKKVKKVATLWHIAGSGKWACYGNVHVILVSRVLSAHKN